MSEPIAPRQQKKLRRQYVNTEYPHVVLKFEDGHEIHLPKGIGKAFDAWQGETLKILAIWDPTSGERELVESKKGEEFPEAKE